MLRWITTPNDYRSIFLLTVEEVEARFSCLLQTDRIIF